MKRSAYAEAGVDYNKLQPFKDAMVAACSQTHRFAEKRGIFVPDNIFHNHGAIYYYRGPSDVMFVKTTEGYGNKSWISEWMRMNAGTGRSYYEHSGDETMLMAANDAAAHGGLPVVYVDEAAAGTDDWFKEDKQRSVDLATGFLNGCRRDGIAWLAGESPALRYLVKAEPPVKDAPVLSGTVTSIVSPSRRLITGEKLRPGLSIIGVTSTGLHANGISLVIKEAMKRPDQFLTKLPNGNTLGDEALIPTRSYVALVEALMDAEVNVCAFLPGTGGGVAKLAFDKRPMIYRIHTWLQKDKIPSLFLFMLEVCGISLVDCLTTFNWGMGYYIFVPPHDAGLTISTGTKAGYDLREIGRTEEGPRQTIFGPANDLILPPI